MEKVTKFKYLRQTVYVKDTTKEEIYDGLEQHGAVFGKKSKKYLKINNSPYLSKIK